MKTFNTTGLCVPQNHYMTDLSDKLEQIRAFIDARSYFTINRARQYGKTTLLSALSRYLPKDYLVIQISFEGLDDEYFATPEAFCQVFIEEISDTLLWNETRESEICYAKNWADENVKSFRQLSKHITKMCADKKVVLTIDEVDKTSHNRVFLQFIGMLRTKFLSRNDGKDTTFHSVILVGVYDIKNIKLRLISEGLYTPGEGENKLYNSPWNIAIEFDVDMSFNIKEISSMLKDYECDYNTGMDIIEISKDIFYFTSGYPYLVSRICHLIDTRLDKDWSSSGVQKAVKLILSEQTPLFDDLAKNLENDKELFYFIYELLVLGEKKNFKSGNRIIDYAAMFGIIKNADGKVVISNRIFEIWISDYYISKKETGTDFRVINYVLPGDIIENGVFNMELCLTKFAGHYLEMFNDRDEKFIEREGRVLFLTYLKPLINGKGFYHIESELTDTRKMDIVVDYGSQQFILELKIWRGQKYQEDGYRQLAGYMEKKSAKVGYLLTFSFLKDAEAKRTQGWIDVEEARIFEVVV